MYLTDTATFFDEMAHVDGLFELNVSECAGVASMGRRTIECGCGKSVVIEADDERGVIVALHEKGWFASKHGVSLTIECPDCDARTDELVERQGW